MSVSAKQNTACDCIIIGAGQSGKPLALALAKAGWNTAIVEREHVGGTCVNVGCTPTKAMVASARIAYLARRAAPYGVNLGEVSVNMGQVFQRKQAMVESFRLSGQTALEKTKNVTLIFGEASFIDATTVSVKLKEGGHTQLSAPKIIINTGGRPSVPPLPGIDRVPVLDSSSIMELQTVPEHLVVLGGGYIALEFGQMFRRFGSRVTIIQRDARLISREDPDVSEEVQKILRQDGVELLLNARIKEISPSPDATDEGAGVQVAVETEEGTHVVQGSHLLAALGRAPNTGELNLAAAGVAIDANGYIKVNERLETNISGIYAIGDVKGGPAFTHISYDDFRVLQQNLLADGKTAGGATISGRLVPNTLFIDPQLATVGLSETEARKQGRNIRVAKLPMNRVARAIEVGETRGFMKAVVDADSGQILGCSILGIEGGEIMSMLQIAMMGKVHYARIKDGVFAHPTLAESLNNLFMTLDV